MQIKAPQVKLSYMDIALAVVKQFKSDSPEAEATFQTLNDLEKNFGTREFSPSQTLGVLNVMRYKASQRSSLMPVVDLIQSLIDKEASINWDEMISHEQLKQAVHADKCSNFVQASGIMSNGFEHSEDLVKALRLAQDYLDRSHTQHSDASGNHFTVEYHPDQKRTYTVANKANTSRMNFDISERGLLESISVLRFSSRRGEERALSIEANYNPHGRDYDLSINEHSGFAQQTVTHSNECYHFSNLNQAIKQ